MSTPRERLDAALVAMAAVGERPRCAWPDRAHLWTSDDPEDRARAARRCAGCPVLDLCSDAADEQGETWGVWGGIDRTKTPRTKRKTA